MPVNTWYQRDSDKASVKQSQNIENEPISRALPNQARNDCKLG